MSVSRLDTVYRKMVLTKFFTKGWGNPEHLIRLFAFRKLVSNRETCFQLVSKTHPITIISQHTWSDCKIIEGKFLSPLALHLPDILPQEIKEAYFQMVVPLKWKSDKHKPICIHLAGTGDHYYWRRRNIMAKPLLMAGIGSIILENPYYGLRKPKNQMRSCLHNVSDIFVMGGCLILECLVLLHWCEQLGFGPLGLSGLSMGGHMASLAATNWPKPVVLVPCLSWSTASAVFTEGVMSDSIDWRLLEDQYTSDSLFYETLANLVTIVDNSNYVKMCHQRHLSGEVLSRRKIRFDFMKKIPIEHKLIKKMHELSQTLLVSKKFLNPKYKSVMKKPENAVHFMRGIMDECTHLRNFSVPLDTSLIIAVCARADGYVPREGCSSLEDIWPGANIRYLDAGHVSAYILHRKFFRKCIMEAFDQAILKYY